MNILFIVHGNGNGHQTQAIALKEEFEKRGHNIVKCVLTSSGNTRKGNLVDNEFDDFSKIAGFELKYRDGTLDFARTSFGNLFKSPKIAWALNQINNMIRFYAPDLVVSFYDPMYQITQKLYKFDVPYVSVGHMYMFEDQNFGFHEYDARFSFLKIYNRLTCMDSKQVYSLSYIPSDNPNLLTVGPALRDEILEADLDAGSENKISGYFHHLSDAKRMCKALEKYKSFSAVLFSNTKKVVRFENSEIRPVNSHDFVKNVSESRIFVSSSGFESTSESIFLGKKVLTIPIQNHIEQELNCKCLESDGLVYPLYSWENIDDKLASFLFDFKTNDSNIDSFRNYVKQSRLTLVDHAEKNFQ